MYLGKHFFMRSDHDDFLETQADGWLGSGGEGRATDGTIHASLDPQTCYANE